jgi:dienelactone hydrolase
MADMIRTLTLATLLALTTDVFGQSLPNTAALEPGRDWARVMLDGIHRYLDRETAASIKQRDRDFKPDLSSPEAYERSLEPQRQRLRRLLGLVDERSPATGFEILAAPGQTGEVYKNDQYRVFQVRWNVLPGITGEGLMLVPTGPIKANIIAIADADQNPDSLAGLEVGFSTPQQFARRLAENGCRVVIPVLVDRSDTWSGNPRIGRVTNESHREFIWRMAYQMGRHLLGYELQRILAAVDRFDAKTPIGIYGYGDGGRLALLAAAVDPRIKATVVSGSFGSRESLHDEPIDHDIWDLLHEFGDAELARMVMPRSLFIEQVAVAQPKQNPAKGRDVSAPGKFVMPSTEEVEAELRRGMAVFGNRDAFAKATVMPDRGNLGSAVAPFLKALIGPVELTPATAQWTRVKIDWPAVRKRQFDELVAYTQNLLAEGARNRQKHVWSKLDLKTPENFVKSQEPLREKFWQETIGKLPEPVKDMKPRTRLWMETPKWKGYEVVLDVMDDVISYGILLVPNDIKPGEKRPCVVCQHGLEGRPSDVCDPKVKSVYRSFGAQLADQGFVVFAPQAPYIFKNDFRQAVRKMHPLGLTLYAFIIRQHEQILNFLETLPFVDATRIAYYGLSYGGKVAVRIPAILLRYCAVICSGDFNEWIWKNITLDWGSSYMFTNEYEMYEFNLGNTFNYAEMTALIAPRPFMVERGHDDGVGLDEYVAFEFAKTRRLYDRLGIGDRTELEFFNGGHEIHGRGTFAFLRRHLRWPASQ